METVKMLIIKTDTVKIANFLIRLLLSRNCLIKSYIPLHIRASNIMKIGRCQVKSKRFWKNSKSPITLITDDYADWEMPIKTKEKSV